MRAVLAFAAVPGILLGLVALYAVTRTVERVDALSRVLQGAMLAIIGFYFGRVGVARVEREADDARAQVSAVAGRASDIAAQSARTEEWVERAATVLSLVEKDDVLRRRLEELLRQVEADDERL